MTLQEYLDEHAPNEGDGREFYCCEYCGEEIETGCEAYSDGELCIHAECFMEWVTKELFTEDVASSLGFVKRSG